MRLGTGLAVAEYRNGNDRDNAPRKITGLSRVADVTLKRGIIGSLALFEWLAAVRNGDAGALRTVTVTLLAEDRTPALSWRLIGARPVAYRAGPLDARGAEVAIEELSLAYERLELE